MDNNEEIKLIEKAQSGDQEAMSSLFETHGGLIMSIVQKYNTDNSVFEDCLQEARIGFLEAINKYDVNKGGSLGTYAYNFIKKSVLTYLYGDTDSKSYKKYALIKKYREQFVQENEYEPDYSELSEYIEEEEDKYISPEEIQDVLDGVAFYTNKETTDDTEPVFKSEDEYELEEPQEEKQKVTEINPDKPKKSAACIKMLLLLQDGNLHSLKEIAKAVGTNKRNILVYRDELTSLGYEKKEKKMYITYSNARITSLYSLRGHTLYTNQIM